MRLTEIDLACAAPPPGHTAADMLGNAQRTTEFLKSLSHPARLVILCKLAEGPLTVGELEEFLELPQSAVSKQLARLRDDELVEYRRDGRSITYSLSGERTRRVIRTLYEEFCV
jgi:ArsR family transcriptional regulator, virulence genes transcriptional regulator